MASRSPFARGRLRPHRAADRCLVRPRPGRNRPALLVVSCDGAGAAAEAATVARLLAPLASTVEVTEDPVEAEAPLFARRLALPALERLSRPLIEDIAVPRSRLAEAVRECGRSG
ncbi:FAD-linked oxidase C-terminal domain-containing protein [Streptomyces sviceus]|uniref:FAD-linked oxidase C-terminal domain-containing protein n=1 Tax=Streptomyces sviceus TaxID=285530 RepID=UPI0036E80AD2